MRCLLTDQSLSGHLMTGDDTFCEVCVTYLSVQDLLLPVAQRLNDLQDRVKQSEVTQAPCLIIKLLPLCFLGNAHKDVTRLLLTNQRAVINISVIIVNNGWKRQGQRSKSDVPVAGGTVGTSWPQ